MKSGLKRCIMAQNASPSLHEVVMLHTRTFLYPTVCRLVHSSKASLPLNVPDPELFRFESISVKLRANHEKIFLFERFFWTGVLAVSGSGDNFAVFSAKTDFRFFRV